MNNNKKNIKPFVKWVGGKRKVIDEHLRKYLPSSFNRYIEPFVGGGAMFCYLSHTNCIINDINNELITTYRVIKTNPKQLIIQLDDYKQKHSPNFYLNLREKELSQLTDIEIAARFIYLNKCCFNGIYRVNKSGKFNVPMNPNKVNVNLYEQDNILNWSKVLKQKGVLIFNKNYLEVLDMCQQNDFVYCDPPYDYEVGVKGFDAYDKSGFNTKNQIDLCNKLKELDQRGVKWMVSNNNTKLINELYKDFNIIEIKTNRMVNSDASNRIDAGDEVIILNYDYSFDYYWNTLEDRVLDINNLVDFDKIKTNLDDIELDLNTLNYLITNDFEDFKIRLKSLYSKDQSCFKTIFILLALRNDDNNKPKLKINNQDYDFNEIKSSYENLLSFFKSSGLLDLILNNKIKNFVDYVYGIEVGLDTHTRKNRNGKSKENKIYDKLIEILKDFKDISIHEQVVLDELNIDDKNKKFDILIKNKKGKNILIESSFYHSQGSKVSETARAYSKLNTQINNNVSNYQFIWLADGQGIKSIKSTIEPEFSKGYIYNDKTFFDNIKQLITKNYKK